MGKAAAAAALRQARSAAANARNKLESVAAARDGSDRAGPDDGYVPTELASALTALKAMEVLRPEVYQRLVLWVSAAGGGQRAAGEEFGRKSTEVTGELERSTPRCFAAPSPGWPRRVRPCTRRCVRWPPSLPAQRSSARRRSRGRLISRADTARTLTAAGMSLSPRRRRRNRRRRRARRAG